MAKNTGKKLLFLLTQVLRGEMPVWNKGTGFSSRYIKNYFNDFSRGTEIFFVGPSYRSQLNAAIKSKVDLVFPCMDLPPKSFSLPWVGYLFDFQHCYFPNSFNEDELKNRKVAFQKMLYEARHILVNGSAVIDDAQLFFPGYPAKLHALPFCPCPNLDWLKSAVDVRLEYGVDRPYFLLSNQFWRHKDHGTAFKAFAKYRDLGGKALLVCTGGTEDYRSPEYFDELLNLIKELNLAGGIKILGHIPKIDQISLVKNSLAVLQPTLFEGGPGGGSSYDAIALGVPVIASDIPINLEINCGDVKYFAVGNSDSLAKVLMERGLNPYIRQSNQVLLEQGLARRRLAGCFLRDVFRQALEDSENKPQLPQKRM